VQDEEQIRAALVRDAIALREPPSGLGPETGVFLTAGGSIVTTRGVRLDLAVRFRRGRPIIVVGTSVRF
jgi:hypothetical protein